jgi:ketosteroid isomerase-like protein
MSEQNLEAVRRSLDAWNRRDLARALGEMHPDCVVDWSASHGPDSGIYRGRERVRRFYEEWLALFDDVYIQPEALIDAGEHVVVPNRGIARGRGGITVTASSTQVFTFRDGKIVCLRLYQDKEAAFKAVGLAQ